MFPPVNPSLQHMNTWRKKHQERDRSACFFVDFIEQRSVTTLLLSPTESVQTVSGRSWTGWWVVLAVHTSCLCALHLNPLMKIRTRQDYCLCVLGCVCEDKTVHRWSCQIFLIYSVPTSHECKHSKSLILLILTWTGYGRVLLEIFIEILSAVPKFRYQYLFMMLLMALRIYFKSQRPKFSDVKCCASVQELCLHKIIWKSDIFWSETTETNKRKSNATNLTRYPAPVFGAWQILLRC